MPLAFLAIAAARAVHEYRVTIEPEFGLLPYRGLLLLTDPARGHYPPPSRTLSLSIVPEPPTVPAVDWSVTNGLLVTVRPEIRPGQSPKPYFADLDRNGVAGPFTVTARLGPPVNADVNVAGFAYEQIAIGCALGFAGGMSLDAHGVPHESKNAQDADIYLTGPIVEAVSLWDHCSDGFHDAAASHVTLHVPGGGVALDAGPSGFPAVRAQDGRGATATSFDLRNLHGTLLWRTRDGRLVKTLQQAGSEAFIGPMIVADSHGVFADNPAQAGLPGAIERVVTSGPGWLLGGD